MTLLITFEGPEGSGKTTQIRLLGAALADRGEAVLLTREPGGTALGDAIRGLLLDPAFTTMSPRAETLLFQAARAQLVDTVVRPALATGQVVLCDRYIDSTLAYQGYGHGQLLTALRQLGDYATGGLLPTLTLYLDIDVHTGLERKRSGAAEEWNRMENQPSAFHQRVRQGYLALAAADPGRWCLLDASQPVEVLHSLVLDRVVALLAERRPSPARGSTTVL
ncbi:MAG: dTMP kinase [Caldilinea sp.]